LSIFLILGGIDPAQKPKNSSLRAKLMAFNATKSMFSKLNDINEDVKEDKTDDDSKSSTSQRERGGLC